MLLIIPLRRRRVLGTGRLSLSVLFAFSFSPEFFLEPNRQHMLGSRISNVPLFAFSNQGHLLL